MLKALAWEKWRVWRALVVALVVGRVVGRGRRRGGERAAEFASEAEAGAGAGAGAGSEAEYAADAVALSGSLIQRLPASGVGSRRWAELQMVLSAAARGALAAAQPLLHAARFHRARRLHLED